MQIINKSDKTPEVQYDTSKGKIAIKGVIIPENPKEFFDSLDRIISECKEKSKTLSVDFDLDYFNTGAAKYLYYMLKELKNIVDIEISWIYESDDEEILETGKEFEEIIGIKFNFIEK